MSWTWGVLSGLGPYYRANKLRAALDAASIKYAGVEKTNGEAHGFVCFADKESYEAAVARFPVRIALPRGERPVNIKYAGHKQGLAPPAARAPHEAAVASWSAAGSAAASGATAGSAAEAPIVAFDGATTLSGSAAASAAMTITGGAASAPPATDKSIHDVVTPLHAMPYREQLDLKARAVHFALVRVSRKLAETVDAGVAARPKKGHKRGRTDACDEGAASGDKGAASSGGSAQPIEPVEVIRVGAELPEELSWLRTRTSALRGAACVCAAVQPSPDERGYRNKAQWSAGRGVDGQPLFGFFLGSFSSGSHVVSAATDYAHVPPVLTAIQEAGSAFLRASALAPYDDAAHTGVWRTLTVRWVAEPARAIVEVLVAPPAADGARPQLDAELSAFADAMMALTHGGAPVVAGVSVQEYSGASAPGVNDPRVTVRGETTLVDAYTALGLRFRVSPGAFLQVNTRAAERLYAAVRALAVDGVDGAGALIGEVGASDGAAAQQPKLRPALTVLDICCGGGLIGLACAPFVGRVLGVDECEAAILDARENAALNGFGADKANFETGRAETKIDAMLKACAAQTAAGGAGGTAEANPVVAIVDPPRGGLHPAVVSALRSARAIKRVVYVSCNPEASFVRDAVLLCAPSHKGGGKSAVRGRPFKPVCALPFDLFPQTRGVELVTLFERE